MVLLLNQLRITETAEKWGVGNAEMSDFAATFVPKYNNLCQHVMPHARSPGLKTHHSRAIPALHTLSLLGYLAPEGTLMMERCAMNLKNREVWPWKVQNFQGPDNC